MNTGVIKRLGLLTVLIFVSLCALAQNDATATARLDVRQILVGDQAKLFLEVHHNPSSGKVQWPAFTDSFNKLEITEKGKIDTVKQGGYVTYRQRLLITGFDSGLFKIPAFQFAVIPNTGKPYVLQTDSFQLLVQTVAVDTTKGFKPIKNIIFVNASWLDYLWYILGGVLLVLLTILGVVYYMKHRKPKPDAPKEPPIPLQDRVLAQLAALEEKQLWQKNQVKEYYIELTDIVRSYIEERFKTHALELTTDELLQKAEVHKELQKYVTILTVILQTADLAKFAKWQPLPQEHFDAMENAKKFVDTSRPIIIQTQTDNKI